ncbi:MAG: hypothetical protein JW821_18135 [Deltaproteobacteria bacterium]|nr:hypothetical protein [Deltaproteobacteria bacterium]
MKVTDQPLKGEMNRDRGDEIIERMQQREVPPKKFDSVAAECFNGKLPVQSFQPIRIFIYDQKGAMPLLRKEPHCSVAEMPGPDDQYSFPGEGLPQTARRKVSGWRICHISAE